MIQEAYREFFHTPKNHKNNQPFFHAFKTIIINNRARITPPNTPTHKLSHTRNIIVHARGVAKRKKIFAPTQALSSWSNYNTRSRQNYYLINQLDHANVTTVTLHVVLCPILFQCGIFFVNILQPRSPFWQNSRLFELRGISGVFFFVTGIRPDTECSTNKHVGVCDGGKSPMDVPRTAETSCTYRWRGVCIFRICRMCREQTGFRNLWNIFALYNVRKGAEMGKILTRYRVALTGNG